MCAAAVGTCLSHTHTRDGNKSELVPSEVSLRIAGDPNNELRQVQKQMIRSIGESFSSTYSQTLNGRGTLLH